MGVELKSKFDTTFGKLFIGDDLISSVMPRSCVNSSHVLAHCPGGPLLETPGWNVGKVQFFLEVTFTLTVNAAPKLTLSRFLPLCTG